MGAKSRDGRAGTGGRGAARAARDASVPHDRFPARRVHREPPRGVGDRVRRREQPHVRRAHPAPYDRTAPLEVGARDAELRGTDGDLRDGLPAWSLRRTDGRPTSTRPPGTGVRCGGGRRTSRSPRRAAGPGRAAPADGRGLCSTGPAVRRVAPPTAASPAPGEVRLLRRRRTASGPRAAEEARGRAPHSAPNQVRTVPRDDSRSGEGVTSGSYAGSVARIAAHRSSGTGGPPRRAGPGRWPGAGTTSGLGAECPCTTPTTPPSTRPGERSEACARWVPPGCRPRAPRSTVRAARGTGRPVGVGAGTVGRSGPRLPVTPAD